MPVHNVGLCRIQTKFPQDLIHDLFIIIQPIVGILCFYVRFLIFNEITLKSRHLIFAEYRGIRACPDIPEDILTLCLITGFAACIITSSGIRIQNVIKRLSAVFLAEYIDL